jgi:hypothetical protein
MRCSQKVSTFSVTLFLQNSMLGLPYRIDSLEESIDGMLLEAESKSRARQRPRQANALDAVKQTRGTLANTNVSHDPWSKCRHFRGAV